VSFQLRVSAHPTDGIGYGGLLQTPTASDRAEAPEKMRARAQKNGYKNGTQFNGLASQVVYGMLPTPTATSDPKGGCTRPDPSRQRDTLAHALHDPTLGKTSQLNPRFVADMMGFPVNWTELPFQSGEANQSKPTATR
jgi:hypothetical protein